MTVLSGEREHYVVRGPAEQVLDMLEDDRTIAQVIDGCGDVPAPVALNCLVELEQQGLLSPPPQGDEAAAAFEIGARLGRDVSPVALVEASGVHPMDSEAIHQALRGAGLQLVDEPGADTVTVIVTADYLEPTSVELAIAERRAGRRCFMVKPGGLRPFVGPLLSPQAGQPCMACLAHALEQQRPVQRMLQRDDPSGRWPSAPRAALPASVAAVAGIAAIELRQLLGVRGDTAPEARLWTLDFPTFALVAHRVRHRPQCRVCGDAALMARRGERPIDLQSVNVGYRADGGFRREPPDQSYERLRHLVSPVLGPVTHLQPMPHRHTETRPVFGSGYLVTPQPGEDHGGFDRMCAGKGRTVAQARMGALAEAIERASGVHQGDEARRFASFEQLGDEAIHPDSLQLFSSNQRPPSEGPRYELPRRLPDDTPIAWTPGWSLTENRRRYLPLAYCFRHAPPQCGAVYCQPSSNGSAAGTCLEEAILQGLFELVERDAVALWWYARVRRPSARIPASVAGYFDALVAEYAALDWRVWALDLTHDLGVPVVAAVAAHERSDRFVLGFGCHQDPALAMSRALTEVNQVFEPQPTVRSPWEGMSASALAFLHPYPDAPSCEPAPTPAPADLREHVLTWVGRLREHGLEVIVVDKSRPDFELNVAQVVVPGLRHMWPRFAPGRLYTVPVALGWRADPLREEQLNPLLLLV